MPVTIEVFRPPADRDGGDIIEPLLGDSLPAALARGRAELDAQALPRDRVTLQLDARLDLAPGDQIAVVEPSGGDWRGTILGIDHTWADGTATTTLDISRPRIAP